MGPTIVLIAEWLRDHFPIRIVRADEQGSLHKVGRAGGVRGPGWYWIWPFAWELRVYNVAYQQIDLPMQFIPTEDDKDVSFSVNIGYTIADAQLMDILVQDFDTTLRRRAAGWLATKMGKMSYDRIRNERNDIQYELKRSLSAKVKPWGVVIEDVEFTDFGRTKQYRVITNANE